MNFYQILQSALETNGEISSKRLIILNGLLVLDVLCLAVIGYGFFVKEGVLIEYAIFTISGLITMAAGITATQAVQEKKKNVNPNGDSIEPRREE